MDLLNMMSEDKKSPKHISILNVMLVVKVDIDWPYSETIELSQRVILERYTQGSSYTIKVIINLSLVVPNARFFNTQSDVNRKRSLAQMPVPGCIYRHKK